MLISAAKVFALLWLSVFVSQSEQKTGDVLTTNGTHLIAFHAVPPRLETIRKIGSHVVGLAVDARYHLLFWSDIGYKNNGIYKSFLNGRKISKIVADVSFVTGLTVDWTTKRLIWSDTRRRTIESTNYYGTNRRVIMFGGAKKPKALVVDSSHGFIYWADQGYRKIERIQTDGTHRQLLYKNSKFWPNQMTIDETNRVLYCVDAYKSTIMYASLNSPTWWRTIEIERRNIGHHIFGLAVSHSAFYLSTWYKTRVLIYNTGKEELTKGFTDPNSKRFYYMIPVDPSRQPLYANPCNLASRGGCSHICLVVGPQTSQCACPTYGGLVLGRDRKTCIEPSELVLYTIKGSGIVAYMSADIHTVPSGQHIVSTSTMPVALAYHPTLKVVYWSDVKELVIYQVQLNGSRKKIFLKQGIGIVDGMVLDPVSKRLYFSNMFLTTHGSFLNRWSSVESVNLDGTGWLTISRDVGKPRGLAIDFERRHLFISDWGEEPKIVRCNLDGSNSVVIKSTDISNPNGLSVNGEMLYVVDSNYDGRTNGAFLAAYNMSDNTWRYLTGTKLKIPFGIAAVNSSLLFTDWFSGNWASGRIKVYDLKKNRAVTFIKGVRSPSNIIYSKSSYAVRASTCVNNPCSGLCFDQPRGPPICRCPTHNSAVMSRDGFTCKEPENFLLLCDVNTVYLMSLDTPEKYTLHRIVRARFDANIIAATYDSVNKYIYWSESSRVFPKVFKQYLNGTSLQLVAHLKVPSGVIDGLAVDHSTRSLTMSGYNVQYGFIATMPTDGTNVYSLTKVAGRPRGLAVLGGQIFWSDIQSPGRIVRMSSAGKQDVVADTGFKWPNGIAINNGLLYVGDGRDRKIEVMSLNGSNRKELEFFTKRVEHIFGLAVFDQFVFYTDWVNRTLGLFDMKTGFMKTLAHNLVRPTTLHLHHPSKLKDSQHCEKSGCDHCVVTPGGFYCKCPTGQFLLPGGRSCSQGRMKWLPSRIFRCDESCHVNALCGQLSSGMAYRCVCKAGYFGDGVNSCQACPVDTYKEEMGNSSCSLCPSNSSTHDVLGSTTCHCYQANTVFRNNECTDISLTSTPLPTRVVTTLGLHENSRVTNQWSTISHTTQTARTSTTEVSSRVVPPPYFENCPNGELIILALPDHSSTVSLKLSPTARNYNGSLLPVSSNHGTVFEWSGVGSNGYQHVKYWAEDYEGQHVTCAFQVYVLDTTPPRFEFCPTDIAVSTTLKSVQVHWREAVVNDNVDILMVKPSTESGSWFNSGASQVVTYRATDPAGNMASCSFVVSVNEDKVACDVTGLVPKGGALVCAINDLAMWQCNVLCDYRTHALNPSHNFDQGIICADGGWMKTSHKKHMARACLEKSHRRRLSLKRKFTFDGPCNDKNGTFVAKVRQLIDIHFTTESIGHLCPYNSDLQKRECAELRVFCHKTTKDRRKRSSREHEMDVKFTFIISNDSSGGEAVTLMNTTVYLITQYLNTYGYVDSPSDEASPGVPTEVLDVLVGCEDGYTHIGKDCVACPPGTFFNFTKQSCQLCPANTYQDIEAQVTCKPCSYALQSAAGSVRNTDCRDSVQANRTTTVSTWMLLGIMGSVAVLGAILFLLFCWFLRLQRQLSACTVVKST